MHFHILGLGSIGTLVAHHLRRVLPHMHNVTLIHRTRKQAKEFILRGSDVSVEMDGIVSSSKGFNYEVFEAPVTSQATTTAAESSERGGAGDSSPAGFPKERPIDSLIVTTKAHHVLPALQTLLPRISSDATVVLMQNGLGVYEKLIHEVFQNEQQRPHFILASNTHGVYLKEGRTAVHAGVGAIQLGIVPDPAGRDFEAGFHNENIPKIERHLRLTDIEKPFDDPAGERYQSLRATISALVRIEQLNVSWKPISEVQTIMRRKLVVNAVINPLTALMNCRNGDIFVSKSARRIMYWVCQEAVRALTAQHVAETRRWLDGLSSEGIDPQNVDVGRMPPGLTVESLQDEVFRVAEATKGNISSMLSDVRRGNPTEVHYITGYLMKLGQTHNVHMPCTAMLHELVKARGHIPLDQML